MRAYFGQFPVMDQNGTLAFLYGSAERFGPFIVDSNYRGLGIGSILMNDCLSEMKKRGLSGAWMQWSPTEGAADAMYKKIGFSSTKTYIIFSKILRSINHDLPIRN